MQLLPYLKAERDQESIDIDRPVLHRLRAWRKQQSQERLAGGSEWLAEHSLAGDPQPNRVVFTYTNGRRVHPGTFPGWLRDVVEQAGLPWKESPRDAPHARLRLAEQRVALGEGVSSAGTLLHRGDRSVLRSHQRDSAAASETPVLHCRDTSCERSWWELGGSRGV